MRRWRWRAKKHGPASGPPVPCPPPRRQQCWRVELVGSASSLSDGQRNTLVLAGLGDGVRVTHRGDGITAWFSVSADTVTRATAGALERWARLVESLEMEIVIDDIRVHRVGGGRAGEVSARPTRCLPTGWTGAMFDHPTVRRFSE